MEVQKKPRCQVPNTAFCSLPCPGICAPFAEGICDSARAIEELGAVADALTGHGFQMSKMQR